MARSEKNSVEYFPFICKEGKAMFYIENKYGNDGYATWVKILRQLAVTNYHYLDLSNKVDLMFISSKCRVSEEVLESIISDLTDLGEFDKVLWSENRIIWCQKFTDSIHDAYKKRNNECMTYEGLLTLLVSLGIRKPPKSNPKGFGNTQTILKDTKVDETSDPPNSLIHGKRLHEELSKDPDLQMRISKNTQYPDTVIQKKIAEFCERESLNGGKTLNNWRDYCFKSILKNYKNNGTSKPKNRNR